MLKSQWFGVICRCTFFQQQILRNNNQQRRLTCVSVADNSRKGNDLCSNSENKRLSRYSASTIMGSKGNKFNLVDYDIVGFDLDGTLLRYNLPEMVPLEYQCLANSLIRNGYSSELLSKPIGDDIDFLQKGLILDADRGNILKLDCDGRIIKAMHGTSPISDDEIVRIYGEDRTWSVSTEFIKNPLETWNGPVSDQMRTLLDYFDMPASLIMARAVDSIDSREKPSKYSVWPDILSALYDIYKRENFADGTSEYFAALKKDPERYILKTSPKVIEWLKTLRKSGKAIYLLTGSNIDFANLTASHALGENWRELFDSVVCFARKPGFFVETRPFFAVNGLAEGNEIPETQQIQLNQVYSQGNWNQLKELLSKKVGKDINQIRSLYVGDNLIQDVFTPCATNIDTVAISEEMLAEGLNKNTRNGYLPSNYKNIILSSIWNSYFVYNKTPTLWSSVIRKHSKICVPTVEYLTEYSIDGDFNCVDNNIFYPSLPISFNN